MWQFIREGFFREVGSPSSPVTHHLRCFNVHMKLCAWKKNGRTHLVSRDTKECLFLTLVSRTLHYPDLSRSFSSLPFLPSSQHCFPYNLSVFLLFLAFNINASVSKRVNFLQILFHAILLRHSHWQSLIEAFSFQHLLYPSTPLSLFLCSIKSSLSPTILITEPLPLSLPLSYPTDQ